MTWHEARFIQREGHDMLLSLPDIRQNSSFDCGEAAVRTILAFHGIKAAVRLATTSHGTDPTQIEAAFRNIGMGVAAGEMTVADLAHFCNAGRPVVCLVHWKGAADSHYVCVRGVSRGWVYFHDVESGVGKCPVKEFESQWKADGRIGRYRRWGLCPWVM